MFQSANRTSLQSQDEVISGRPRPETEAVLYKAKRGECLAEICRRLTGSADWKKVYDLNRETIGLCPNFLSEGMVLQIPGAFMKERHND